MTRSHSSPATLVLALGCSEGPADAAGTVCNDRGALVASEANNYAFSSALRLATTRVAPGRELSFDWSGLTRDLLGHPLDPRADIDSMVLMLWQLPLAELELRLSDDDLRQSDLAVISEIQTLGERTSGSSFEVRSPGGAALTEEMILPFLNADHYPASANTYTVIVATGETLGAGTRMIQAFTLDPESDNTRVNVGDDSSKLSHGVDLTSLQATPVPEGDAALVFDWSGLKTNALGREFSRTAVTRAVVARDARTPLELEDSFLDLLLYDGTIVADQVFASDVPAGNSIDLSLLVSDTGEAFGGIDAESTWMLALFCGSCRNPAPWYLTFLTPC